MTPTISRTRHLYPQELAKVADAQRYALDAPTLLHMPSVTILLLSLDRLHLTRRCIESIYAHSEYPFELLIHDDGSQPETLAYLCELVAAHPNVQLTTQPTHVGLSAARNLAFTRIHTDYLLSLDNDMICHPGWLRETMACAMRHDADFVAPLRLEPKGHVWGFALELVRTENETVLEIARWFHDLPLGLVQHLFSKADVATNFISGGAGLFSRAAFEACGGFDEGYEVGFEDLDFGLKLAARGYSVWASASAVLTHDDAWVPQTDADVQYVQARYDMAALRRSAARFQAHWNVDVLPPKYVESIQQRMERKLT